MRESLARTRTTGTSKLCTENMRSINFKIDPAQYDVLVQHSIESGISPTSLVRQLTEEFIEKQLKRKS
jgi:hypothetical protein